MTVVETFIICDGGCGRPFGVDNRDNSAKEQRLQARKNGWYTSNRVDYCPECAAKKGKKLVIFNNKERV